MNYGIIAAGEGSRLQQEGVSLPKPLVEIDGKPMIKRLIDIFISCNATTISVIVNEQMTEVRRYLEELAPTLPVELRLCVKSTPSSMHSFHELTRILPKGERFCLTTVDTIFHPARFREFIAAFEADAAGDGYMAVTTFIDDEKPLYVDTDANDRITAFLDAPDASTKYISGGIYALSPKATEVLDRCMEEGISRMRNFQRRLVACGLNLRAWPMGKIIDVDHQHDIETANRLLTNESNG